MTRTYDVSPRSRTSIGFDRLFELLNQAERVEASAAWPPYNIERVAEDQYRITMAVAGFTPEEIDLTQQDTTLLVSGQKAAPESGTISSIAGSRPARSARRSTWPSTSRSWARPWKTVS